MHPNVHSSIIHNWQDMETTYVSINKWIEKLRCIYVCVCVCVYIYIIYLCMMCCAVMSCSAVLWSAWTWDSSCRPCLFCLAGVSSGCQPRWDNHGLLEKPAPVSWVEVFWASSGFWLGVLGCLWHITSSPSLFLPGCVIGIGVCVCVRDQVPARLVSERNNFQMDGSCVLSRD